jgi:REP element-mobilizing transposase RayT
MPNYVRARIPGATYFFTVTTQGRQPVLTRPDVREALRDAINATRSRWPFIVKALRYARLRQLLRASGFWGSPSTRSS